jgi:hypothetical protein
MRAQTCTATIIMPSIPVDVLLVILEHVSKAELVTLCQVNKICCSCSWDALYRNVTVDDPRVTQTLARSTDLAKRVRSFESNFSHPPEELPMALKNMTSLRHLDLLHIYDATILDRCTFQLDSFGCPIYYSELLRKFLDSQTSISYVNFRSGYHDSIPFEQMLPNLTRVQAHPEWFPFLIRGRPVRSIVMYEPDYTYDADDFDLSFLALSTVPLLKLSIPFYSLYPNPASPLISISTFLMHLVLLYDMRELTVVRKISFY